MSFDSRNRVPGRDLEVSEPTPNLASCQEVIFLGMHWMCFQLDNRMAGQRENPIQAIRWLERGK
jgi:hypothetical protein